MLIVKIFYFHDKVIIPSLYFPRSICLDYYWRMYLISLSAKKLRDIFRIEAFTFYQFNNIFFARSA